MYTLVENYGVPFNQLDIFNKLKNDIASGSLVKVNNGLVLRTVEELTNFFITRKNIIDSLQKNGMTVVDDPVTLAIGRYGDIYKTGDGRHRIAAAQTMNINVVGYIKHVHPKWLQKQGNLSKTNIRTALTLLSDQKSRNGKFDFTNP